MITATTTTSLLLRLLLLLLTTAATTTTTTDVMNINEREFESASLAIAARPFCQFLNGLCSEDFLVANVSSSGLNAVLCGMVVL